MIYHILNGDSLAEKFPADIGGQPIVIREAFMDGPVSETFDTAYWDERMQFVARAFDADAVDYGLRFGSQLEMMREIKPADEVILWFEDDLFCQVNMWMAVNYIQLHVYPTYYRVFPNGDTDRWSGFGNDDEASLKKLAEQKIKFNDDDVSLIQALWKAYVNTDVDTMRWLAQQENNAMRFLPTVMEAHIDRLHADAKEKQPEKMLNEIVKSGKQKFEEIFEEFSKRAGVYGYGDVQIRKIVRTEDRKKGRS